MRNQAHIVVCRDCIDRGDLNNPQTCMVALAARKAGLQHVSVGNCYLRFYNDGKYQQVLMPAWVTQHIQERDEHGTTTPFAFDVEW